MKEQLHKRFTDDQIKMVLDLYIKKFISLEQALLQLGCSRRRFYQILRDYKTLPHEFTISYARNKPNRYIPQEIEDAIFEELERDRDLIGDENTSLRDYNYSYIRDEIMRKYGYKVSAQTVRNRAKKWGYWIPKMKRKKLHNREVMTEAVGMLLQHDSSYHRWSPYVDEKWTLITTLDDYSRYLLYANFVKVETAWAHIQALEAVILKYGIGLAYYVDNHSIFRFISHQDSMWQNQVKKTDEALTQWKRVLEKCNMQVWYASSPQGKGKIERPYRWLQDRIIRRCARENVKNISQANIILKQELERYNERQVHSTTGEIPGIRFRSAIQEGKSCFKPFTLPSPYTSTKDIFCLHTFRKVNGYNKISWNGRLISVPIPLPQGTEIELHIIPSDNRVEVRLWYKDEVIKVIHYKN